MVIQQGKRVTIKIYTASDDNDVLCIDLAQFQLLYFNIIGPTSALICLLEETVRHSSFRVIPDHMKTSQKSNNDF